MEKTTFCAHVMPWTFSQTCNLQSLILCYIILIELHILEVVTLMTDLRKIVLESHGVILSITRIQSIL